jgi:DNA mismatch repair protein MutL
MMAALEEAYQNQKMVGKFPACVLHLRTKLNAVDVNVHPAKTEIKFGNERAVFSAVYHAVLSALEGDRSHPAMTIAPKAAAKPPVSPPARPQNETPLRQTRLDLPTATVSLHDSAYRPQRFAPQAPAAPAQCPVPTEKVAVGAEKEPVSAKAPKEGHGLHRDVEKSVPFVDKPREKVPDTSINSSEMQKTDQDLSKNIENVVPEKEPLPWRLAGEVLNTYLIVEQGETVFFIDKHAAHERMNFDRMKAQGYEPMAQTLLTPVTCRLPEQEQAVLLERLPLLEEFGFDVDELGGKLVVRQAPFDVDAGDVADTLSELAQKLLSTGDADPAAARDEMLHTMACKAAIKGGWKTSPQEQERVAQAVMSGQVKYCPHGRPVAIQVTKKELEKQFKRA